MKQAEAMGEIKTMPEVTLPPPVQVVEKSSVIDNPEEFRMAIGNAQMEGLEYIEVTEKLFKYLMKNQKVQQEQKHLQLVLLLIYYLWMSLHTYHLQY